MASFSRFDGDNNEELYKLQFSILYDVGYDSAIPIILRESISRYKNCMYVFEIYDEITRVIDRGCPYKIWHFSEIIEIIAAYYRFMWGLQYHIEYPDFDIPKTESDWVAHYKEFLFKEGKILSETQVFFPSIIHLLAIQDIPYFYDLKKHLLLVMSDYYSDRVFRKFERKISFLSSEQRKELEEHEKNFVGLAREQILELIENQRTDNNQTLI